MESPELLVNSRKLDVALRMTTAQHQLALLDDSEKLSSRILLSHATADKIRRATLTGDLWPCILSDMIQVSTTGHEWSSWKVDSLPRIMRLVRENVTLQHNHLLSGTLLIHRELDDAVFQSWLDDTVTSTPLLRNLVFLESRMGEIIEKHGALEHRLRSRSLRSDIAAIQKITRWTIPEVQMDFFWNKEVVHITYQNTSWLLPSPYLLLIHNKICDCLSSLLLIKAASGVCYERDAHDLAVEFLSHLSCLAATHSGYFEIAKSLEGLVVAEILSTEEDWPNVALKRSIAHELDGAGFDYYGSNLECVMRRATSPFKHELAGLIKIPGHPLIDIMSTSGKAEERATVAVDVNYYAIQMTRNLALEQLIRNYIVKHGTWPPVILDDLSPPILVEAHRLGRDPNTPSLTRKYGHSTSEMYVHVELGEFQEFNRLSHYSQYLKDKALSVLRPTAIGYYITKEIDRLDWKETRLLLMHLLHHEDELALPDYLQDYIRSSDEMEDVLNYLTVKLVPKEKELKVCARPFGCKTYQDRYRGCVQEENVKNLLDQYFEDQAMTLDNLSLVKRLYSFRHLVLLYKDWRVLYINFDVSGWCGNFRHETVEPIGTDILDKAFGTRNLFRKTQLAYEKGFFYLPDSEGTYHWEGQQGGIEGLNQYTWMLVYIPQMRYALQEFGLHFYVMAYGDDYKAALLIPPTQQAVTMDELKHRVVSVVANTARMEFGQKMKIFDSYGSEVYISFCKQASIRGIEMPQGVRKIQKCYGATNAFLPTLDDYVSSAFSNAHSAARTMPCTYPAYVVALFWGYLHLVQHQVWDVASDNELHCAMLTPSCVGGLPVLFLANFHTRAENDHLPMFLDLLKHCLLVMRELGSLLTHALSFQVVEGAFETLLRDPYSLPIEKPPLPSGLLRREVIPALKPIIRNTEVRMLVEAASDDWSEKIVRCLQSASEYPARVFSSIFSCTPKALVEEIVKRFETSASIRDILVMRRGPGEMLRILRRVVRGELTLQEWRYKRFHQKYGLGEYWSPSGCTTEMANRLRRLWGRPVVGVTMPALPHLVTITHGHMATPDPYSRSHHFTYTLLPRRQVVKNSFSEHWMSGDQKPFLGHRTKLGSDIPQAKIIDSNPFLSKIKTLLDIISWVNIGELQPDGTVLESNLEELVYVLLSQYYRGDPRELIPFGAKRRSGTIQHHWRSPHYTEHIMPNTLYNTYTWVCGESNTHEMLRGTVHHHTLNFLQVYCFSVHLLQIGLEFSPRLRGETGNDHAYWVITNDCTHCMAPIREGPIIVAQDRIPISRQHVLEGLEITSLSRTILRSATDTLKDLRPRGIRESAIPVQCAVNGLVQSLAEQSTAKASRVCVRMDTPMRTPEEIEMLASWIPGGWNELVREREIRHCPITDLTTGVLVQIYHMTFRLGTRRSVRAQLHRVWGENPRKLLWTGLIDRLYKSGRLVDVIITCQRISGISPPLCYDNPLTAAKYLGESALSLGLHGSLPLSFTWLTYYETDELDRVLNNFHRHAIYTAIWTRLKPMLLAAQRARRRDERLIYDLIATIYYVGLSTHLDHSVLERIFSHAQEPSIGVSLTEIGHVTEESYEDALETPDHILHEVIHMLERYTHQLAGLTHPVPYDFLAEYGDDVLPIAEQYVLPFTNITIHQTSLIDCVTFIRELPDSKPLEYRHGTPSPGARDLGRYRPEGQPAFGFFCRGRDPPAASITPDPPPIIEVFPTIELMLYTHSLSRPYGQATASMNKILEILCLLGVPLEALSGLNIMCLGEGYGGILDMFARLGQGSHFLYNTIPPSMGAYTTPGVALEALEAGQHTWDEQLVNTAVFDLSQAAVAHAIIENDQLRYAVTTCDAESDWEDGERYHRLIRNVVHIHLSKRTQNAVLICKVMLEYRKTVTICMSVLAAYSHRVGLVRSRASPPGGEMYIVAIGFRRPYDLRADEAVQIIPGIDRLIVTTIQRMTNHWNEICPPADHTITAYAPPHLDALKRFKTRLHLAGINRILGRHLLPFKLTQKDRETLKSLRAGITREARMLCETTVEDFWHRTETAAGAVHLSSRIILLRSLEIYACEILTKRRVVLNHGEVRNKFLEQIRAFAPRLVYPEPPAIFYPKVEIHGVTCSPFGMWLEGIDILLSTWTGGRL